MTAPLRPLAPEEAASHAAAARRLWDASERLTGVAYDFTASPEA